MSILDPTVVNTIVMLSLNLSSSLRTIVFFESLSAFTLTIVAKRIV